MKSFLMRGMAGCAVAALAMLGGTAAVSAQQAEAESPWVKVCNTDPSVNKEICLVTQELRTATGQFLSSVAIREISGEARKTLLIAVPTGMLIQPGMRVQIDAGKQTEAKYGICFPNACYSELVIDDAFVAQLKKGSKLVITALNQQAKPVPLELTLAGFTKIYDGAAMDVGEIQKKQEQLQSELQRRADEARQKLIDKQKEQTQSGN
ncbi:MAG: invasion associated locus B family protein [Pannonibacter phragmitetus]